MLTNNASNTYNLVKVTLCASGDEPLAVLMPGTCGEAVLILVDALVLY